MCRSICALLLVLTTCTIHAAPAPEPFFKTGWDKPVDPSRDCKFVYRGRTVTIELPGTDHDLAPKRKRFNAPRILRTVEGDFVMQVRVSGSFRASAKSSVDAEDSSVAAGLVLIPADENCIRLEYGAFRPEGDQRNNPAFRMWGEQLCNMDMDWQVPWKKDAHATKEEHIYLSLDRRGHYIYEAISPDGEKWAYQFRVVDQNLPAKLKVGLAAYSTSTEPFKTRFDNFKLELGRGGKDVRKNMTTYGRLK